MDKSDVSSRKSSFSRMKEAAAVLALVVAVGCTPGKNNETKGLDAQPMQTSAQATASAPVAASAESVRTGETVLSPIPIQRPEMPTLVGKEHASTPPFAFKQIAGPTNDKACHGYPEIEQWSQKRNLDPMLVRALIYTESGFDPCAAAKVCSKEAIHSKSTMGCFVADFSGNSEGYSVGYDEMHDPRSLTDPANACPVFPTAPAVPGKSPDWRWLATGLMQTVEPPYTFWPASYSPDNTDGPYADVYKRSPLSNNLRRSEAKECNPQFNPFNPNDSVCLGTANLESLIRYGHAWIRDHSSELGFSDTAAESDKANVFAAYIAANMYTGHWVANTRNSTTALEAHPSCTSSMTNAECYVSTFGESRITSKEYCASGKDGLMDAYIRSGPDKVRCKGGLPRWEPPNYCYGATDFVRFVRECWSPHSYHPDVGANVMSTYYWLNKSCK